MPVTDTITVATATNNDTTQWEPGWGNWYANDLLFGLSGYSNAQYASTIRFPNITIPQGSTITSAIIHFVAEQSWNAPYPIKVYFNAADNAVAPTSYATAQTKLSALTNYIAWTPGNWTAESSYASADLSSVLQEIVNRSGFVSGNAIMAVIYGTIGVPAYTYNLQNPYAHSTSKRPYIVITYIDYTIGRLYRVDAMRALIRTQLKESSDAILTDAIILQAINDGYREVASRAFCIEHEDTVTTVAGSRLVPFSGHRVVEVKYGTKGLLKIIPPVAGHANISGNAPQYWFQWGRYIVIEPVPDAAYSLTLSVSDYPTAALTLDTEFPTSLPDEFHPCIVDFACYVLSLKLHNWKQAGEYYNRYIANLKKRKQEYIEHKAEKRLIHTQPNIGG